jgi:hypothetical protein
VRRPGIGHNKPPKAKSVPLSYEFGDPIPEKLGIVADHFREVRDLRLAMDKEVKEVKARETELNNHLIDNLATDDNADTGASGLKFRAQITTSEKATVDDWESVWDYVVANDRFDILGKSVNQKTIDEIWATGKKIPGISKMNAKKVSITKI